LKRIENYCSPKGHQLGLENPPRSETILKDTGLNAGRLENQQTEGGEDGEHTKAPRFSGGGIGGAFSGKDLESPRRNGAKVGWGDTS